VDAETGPKCIIIGPNATKDMADPKITWNSAWTCSLPHTAQLEATRIAQSE